MIIAFLLAAATFSGAEAAGFKGRERLGIRLGGIFTSDPLSEYFGAGTELEIHFMEGLGKSIGVDIALSMHSFGRSNDMDKNFDYIGKRDPVELQIYSLTAGFAVFRNLGRKISLSAESGLGLYTVTSIIPSGIFYEGRIYRNQFGFYGGLHFYYRLNRQGLSLDIGTKYHYVLSGEDPAVAVYSFTGEEKIGFFQVTVGIIFFTR